MKLTDFISLQNIFGKLLSPFTPLCDDLIIMSWSALTFTRVDSETGLIFNRNLPSFEASNPIFHDRMRKTLNAKVIKHVFVNLFPSIFTIMDDILFSKFYCSTLVWLFDVKLYSDTSVQSRLAWFQYILAKGIGEYDNFGTIFTPKPQLNIVSHNM